ncbi:uncharacterized protein VTP21DRAFT_6513 [Calcarisporiella thermophila]|uniref:uncharacterized protein n=1 Tax=Calcarisporiella thermophila TaxID=911321 RepID=UPI003743CB7C
MSKRTVRLKLGDSSCEKALNEITNLLLKTKKCIVVTGAGISCSAGIPDFRSSDGLYNLVKSKYPTLSKGQDLFDATVFLNPDTTAAFYTFIGELKQLTQRCTPTRTHAFIRRLFKTGRLLRCYTQNIDGLETKSGMETRLENNPSVVQLHGSMEEVRCTLCNAKQRFSPQLCTVFSEGRAPPCMECEGRNDARRTVGRRPLAVGRIRPDIALYSEEHPHGETIGRMQIKDLRAQPDLLLVMGTSLKVTGIRAFVREMAKAVHARGGKVIFVNRTEIAKEWETVFDYHVLSDTDAWSDRVDKALRAVKKQVPLTRFLKAAKNNLKKSNRKNKKNILALATSGNTDVDCRIESEVISPTSKSPRKRPSPSSDSEKENYDILQERPCKKAKPMETPSPRKRPRLSNTYQKESIEYADSSPPVSQACAMLNGRRMTRLFTKKLAALLTA